MYNNDEIIKMKWTTRNKSYYTEKGYEFTQFGDEFDITINDLPLNSNVHITAFCDCENCSNEQSTPFRNYNKIIANNGIYRCKSCAFNDSMKERDRKSHDRLYDLFLKKMRRT